jgi:hypothetical protein
MPRLHGVEGFGTLQRGIAAPDIGDRHLDGAQQHEHEGREHGVIDEALGGLHHHHGLVAHQPHIAPHEPDGVGEEAGAQHVHRQRQRAAEGGGQEAVDEVHLDVAGQAHAHGGAPEHHHHQGIARQFLGPGEAVVQHVAGEELGEDEARHGPEDDERHPVLQAVDGEVHGGLLLEGLGQFLAGDACVNLGVRLLGHGGIRAGGGDGNPSPATGAGEGGAITWCS